VSDEPSDPDGGATPGVNPATSHYFDTHAGGLATERRVELFLPDLSLALATSSGVFSADGIDVGTKILLAEGGLPSPTARRIADVGCGYGPIALALATRAAEAHIWAVDTNDRARELTVLNAQRAGLSERITVCSPDQVPGDLVLDEIWSNPPIRIGKPALRELLTLWLNRLGPAGRAMLVVQKHLGADSLVSWMNDEGWSARRVVSRRAYRILEVTRSTPPTLDQGDDR